MKRFFILLTALTICGLIGCDLSGSDDSTTRQPAVPTQKIAGMTLTNLFNNPTDGTVNLSNIELTDDNIEITIDKALTVTGSNTNLNNALIRITTDGVSLDNINNISVIVEKSVGNGSTKIISSSLSSLTIYGGGMHTIDISGTKIDDTTLDKAHESDKDQFVRLLCNDATKFTKSLNIQQSSLLYSDGNNNFDGSKLKINKGVTLGSNKKFDDLSDDYAAVTVTDEESQKQFISVVAKDSTLDQAFFVDAIEKTFESVPTQIIKSNTAPTPISFTESVSENASYIVPKRKYDFTLTFDKDKATPYTLKDKVSGTKKDLTIESVYDPRYITQTSDDMGNLYFTQKVGTEIKLVYATYSALVNMFEGNEYSVKSVTIKDIAFEQNKNVIDNYAISLAMYKKGIRRHLYVSWKRLWSADNIVKGNDNNATYYLGRPTVDLYDLIDTTYNHDKHIDSVQVNLIGSLDISTTENPYDNIPGIISGNASSYYFYTQGIAVDADENVYINITKFDVTTDAGNVVFSCDNSLVRKYTPNITNSTFSLTKPEDKSYGGLGITTSYTYPNTIESNPITLADITAAYTFGVTDMRYDGEDVVIEYCDNDGTTKSVTY
ncbi:MAG: hypothetical protein IKQ61_09220 [Spirochaetales bacterium]|nr:hypothetical protein [Spirochaetales bacterium]